MQLKDVMTRDVETIRSDAMLQQAAQKMTLRDVGMLPVVNGDKNLLGTITDRDITVRATAQGLDPTKTQVRSAMTEVVICGFEDQDIEEGGRLMMDNQIRRLLILNRHNKLVGVVSLGDLAIRADGERLPGQVLERVSESAMPKH